MHNQRKSEKTYFIVFLFDRCQKYSAQKLGLLGGGLVVTPKFSGSKSIKLERIIFKVF